MYHLDQGPDTNPPHGVPQSRTSSRQTYDTETRPRVQQRGYGAHKPPGYRHGWQRMHLQQHESPGSCQLCLDPNTLFGRRRLRLGAPTYSKAEYSGQSGIKSHEDWQERRRNVGQQLHTNEIQLSMFLGCESTCISLKHKPQEGGAMFRDALVVALSLFDTIPKPNPSPHPEVLPPT